MRVIKKYILAIAVLYSSQLLAQTDAGCPSINIGEDIDLECANTCIDLVADVLEVGNTAIYEVESIAYSPFPFNQGTPILVGFDDVWSEVIPIPFMFCFFENSYNELVIGANGVMTFDVSLASPANFTEANASYCDWQFTENIPNTNDVPYRNSINGAYHDIDPSISGNIRIDVVGEAPCRIFIINYEDVPHYSFTCNSITTSQQILLYETTNVIEVIIEDKPTCSFWNSGNALIGIQNEDGTLGYTPPNRNTGDWSASTEAWRFVPSANQSYSIAWFDQDGLSLGSGPDVTVCPNINSSYSSTVTYTACDGSEVSDSDQITISVINQVENSIVEINSCDSYLWNEILYNSSGLYISEATSENGCDSLAILELNIYASSASFATAESCGQYSWNGNTYTSSGLYELELTDVTGCDSTATLSLTINESTSSLTSIGSCEPYFWNDQLYEASGYYTYLTVNSNGCDSLETLELTINASTSSLTAVSSCEQYDWNGTTYDSSGSYFFETINENGCDSIATLDLTISSVTTSLTSESSCDQYIWNGNNYTTSGIYEYQTLDINGCDSIATLNLTINPSSASLTSASSCPDYFWNGNNYSSSGIYEYQTINSNGCDSITSLELTITPSTSSNTSISACNEYSWNESTYSSSGVYTYQTINSTGCDSIANLNLTINSPTSSIYSINSCIPYIWNGDTYSSSGVYEYLSTNASGCDSIARLDLVINDQLVDETFSTVNSCEKFIWNDETYITSGDYIFVSSNQYGCDSINYLSLNIYSNYIYVPTAFTPDNDGVNDAFKVNTETLQVFELKIYNRWGEMIFHTNNLNESWNGSHKNGDYFCPDGVYTWQVRYRCKSEVYEKRGHVALLR